MFYQSQGQVSNSRILSTYPVLLILIFLKRFYLFIFTERGRKGKKQGEKHWCERETSISLRSYVSPRNLTCNPGMCPDREQTRDPPLCGQQPTNWATPVVLFSCHFYLAPRLPFQFKFLFKYFCNKLRKDTKMLTLESIKNNVNVLKERVREKRKRNCFCVRTHILSSLELH